MLGNTQCVRPAAHFQRSDKLNGRYGFFARNRVTDRLTPTDSTAGRMLDRRLRRAAILLIGRQGVV